MKLRFVFALCAVLFVLAALVGCSCGSARDEAFADVVGDDLTEEEYATLRDAERYRYPDGQPGSFVLTDQPVLRYFPFLYPQQMAESPSAFADDPFLWNRLYVVFDEKPILLKLTTTDPVTINVTYPDESLPFVRDLLRVREKTTILGVRCTVENVVLSNTCDPMPGVILYYETDRGTFVRFYPLKNAEGEWFTLDDFTAYAGSYVQYLLDNVSNEDEEPLTGQMAFREYLDAVRAQGE